MASEDPVQRLSVGARWKGYTPGGVWGGKVCSGSGGWVEWCDRTEEVVEVHAAAHNLHIYWRKRVSSRVGGGGGGEEVGWPALDSRLIPSGRRVGRDWMSSDLNCGGTTSPRRRCGRVGGT